MIRGVLPSPLRFLTVDEVRTLHETSLDRYGGSAGTRDYGLLESEVSQPQQAFGGEYLHAAPFGMAAAYLFHLCQNHPFVDGNKRTALAAGVAFLRLNGWDVVATQDDAADCVLAIASGRLGKDELERWIEASVKPRPHAELRDFFATVSMDQVDRLVGAAVAGAHGERAASMREAEDAIPIISEMTVGAMAAEASGHEQSALILRQWAILLTALYRIAEDQGYEW